MELDAGFQQRKSESRKQSSLGPKTVARHHGTDVLRGGEQNKALCRRSCRHAEFLVVDWEAMGAEWSLFHEPTDEECVRDLDILSYCFMRIPKRDPRP